MDKNRYFVGLDIGSTTAKICVLDEKYRIVFSDYRRHNTEIIPTLRDIVALMYERLGKCNLGIRVTGTAGMGLSERFGIPFVQEVVASCETAQRLYEDVKTLIDIGGEDSKLILFNRSQPDIRMNGNCAGGTGAFIDQMSKILNISIEEMDSLAGNYQKIYPVSSRCAVFAKTDVQNMISRHYRIEDICASVFNAVAIQTINSLARGCDIDKKILFAGGPLKFIKSLRDAFKRVLNLRDEDIVVPEHPELIVALGVALSDSRALDISSESFSSLIADESNKYSYNVGRRLEPLFEDENQIQDYINGMNVVRLTCENYESAKDGVFLGIDSGSTTTKVVLVDKNGGILSKFYDRNNGKPVEVAVRGLNEVISDFTNRAGFVPHIIYSAATGYGEELIRTALGLDGSIVETMAHFRAAKRLNKDVSFILDIGGQDMKAMFIDNGFLNNLVINEACSSGCGSFLMSFANSLGIEISDFSLIAASSKAPCDLGTRCTVFMGSKIKQALKEGASISDIAAGLSYSVIKNCLYKMLRLRDTRDLGDTIVVQGGTFKNISIIRAFEKELNKRVFISDVPELMGAYGAALYAQELYYAGDVESRFTMDSISLNYKVDNIRCAACENRCEITRYTFGNGNRYFNGNRCERIFSNRSTSETKGFNFVAFKNEILFSRVQDSETGDMKIGIPRMLSMYENFVFFYELFKGCGFDVVVSDPSTVSIYEKGLGTVMADNICFPAKLSHGHIMNLIEKRVDRIFYPILIYERKNINESSNTYNCPIVASYADVIRSAIDPYGRYRVSFDSPAINLKDESLLKSSCFEYLSSLGVDYSTFSRAFDMAQIEYIKYRTDIINKGKEIIERCKQEDRPLFVFAQRPYHIDPLINQNVARIVSDLGIDSITEDVLEQESISFEDIFAIPQWAFINRIIKAAKWVNRQSLKTCLIQINSFGCGPDSFLVDEVKEIVTRGGHYYLMIRVDEFSNTGSIKLRLNSLKETLKNTSDLKKWSFVTPKRYTYKDRYRKIIVPHFSDIYSPFIPPVFRNAGVEVEVLPPADYKSVEYGLKYVNNEVCYPATIVIGDLIKALFEKGYDHSKIAVALTQTGGQCRASNYVPLLKKALVAAGFSDIPVVSIGFDGDVHNDQPGFVIDWKKIIKIAFISGLYADALARMYYATRAREVNRGESREILHRFIDAAEPYIEKSNYDGMMALLNNAVESFNRVKTQTGTVPRIGIVGEIFLKYNDFSNNNTAEWLLDQGIEVFAPQIADFFMQFFVNMKVNAKRYIEKASVKQLAAAVLEVIANEYIGRIERILQNFKFYTPTHDIFTKAYKASRIVDLVNQFGEGWLIPAEISSYAESGVNNVVSLQPFGCIANHIVSKGVEKVLKKYYPALNLLFLDFDSSTSEVNIFNRLYFMVRNAKESTNRTPQPFSLDAFKYKFN